MIIKRLTFITLLFLLLVSVRSFSQDKVKDQRLQLAREFLIAVREGVLTNGQIVKKYAVQGNYFTIDSIKVMADGWLNDLRRDLKRPNEKDIIVLKFIENEKEFVETNSRTVKQSSAATNRMKFTLVSPTDPKKRSIEVGDLYGVNFTFRTEDNVSEEGSLFILFNDENKIMSFAGLSIGNQTTLIQF